MEPAKDALDTMVLGTHWRLICQTWSCVLPSDALKMCRYVRAVRPVCCCYQPYAVGSVLHCVASTLLAEFMVTSHDRFPLVLGSQSALCGNVKPTCTHATMSLRSTGAVDLDTLRGYRLLDHMPFDPTVKRTESVVATPDGRELRVTKGAPHVVLQLVGDEGGLHARVQQEVCVLGVFL